MKSLIIVGLLLMAACTGTPAATSSTSTTKPRPESTTSRPDPCPDEVCVRIHLDPEAVWSDGTPVTATDFVHTWELERDERISAVEAVADHELVISLPEPVPVQWLFEVVLPAHDATATSGGHQWDGSRLEGSDTAVEVVVADGVRGVIQALRRGEAEATWLTDPPAWAVDELSALEDVSVAIGSGPDWEMITFNQANPLLAEEWLRVAFATALDREAILDATVRTVDPQAVALGSTVGAGSEAPYPHSHDPGRARRLLEDNGCVPGSDGIYECGDQRVSFVWATTAGDAWRETALELAVDQLAEAGIEIIPSLLLPADLYASDHLFGDGWDIASFAWTSDTDPRSSAPLFRCQGELNIGGHCDEAVDEMLDAAMATDDPEQWRDLLGEVDAQVVASAAVVPLYRRPIVSAGSLGFSPPPFAGPFDGLQEWEGQVRLALPKPPADPSVVGALDPVTASLRRALYRGAFRALADGGYAPDLVVDFEIFWD